MEPDIAILQDAQDKTLAFFQQNDLPVKRIISGTCNTYSREACGIGVSSLWP